MAYLYEYKVTTRFFYKGEPTDLTSFDIVVAPTSAAAEAMVKAKGAQVLGVNLLGAVGYSENPR